VLGRLAQSEVDRYGETSQNLDPSRKHLAVTSR
jgi:hypothetical protein